VSLDAMRGAFDYLRANPEVRDVIVSGGDPLVMSTDKLVRILEQLRAIPSVLTIRLATRVPVTLPMRIGRELVRALRPHHPIWVMTHFNHPREVTREARRACEMLADGGFPVMNQTVLLRGINDDPETLEALFTKLVRARVRPYYLLQMDPVRGSAHLRTPLARGVEIMRALQGRVSGIALPKFVCDTPGGKGKVVLAHDPVVGRAGKRTTLRTFRGEDVDYIDP
jgi:lysine 2,3-aminomutase